MSHRSRFGRIAREAQAIMASPDYDAKITAALDLLPVSDQRDDLMDTLAWVRYTSSRRNEAWRNCRDRLFAGVAQLDPPESPGLLVGLDKDSPRGSGQDAIDQFLGYYPVK